MANLHEKMILWEKGELSDLETLQLFGEVIRRGYATLSGGTYAERALTLVEEGWLTQDGELGENVLIVGEDAYMNEEG